jgi:hypothetical protein
MLPWTKVTVLYFCSGGVFDEYKFDEAMAAPDNIIVSFLYTLCTYGLSIWISNHRLMASEEDLLIRSLTSSLHTLSLERVSTQQLIVQKKRRKLEEQRLERAIQAQSIGKIIENNSIKTTVKLTCILYSMSRL